MKIKYAIHSSDSNPFYLDFWPLVAKVWVEKFNIIPVLVYIDEKDLDIPSCGGLVIKKKPIEGVPIYLQNLWVRYWIPSIFPDDVSIISDIDMFPLSRFYFVDQLVSIDENKYIHLHPNIEGYGTLSSCYHVAKGSVFKDILELHDVWEDSMHFLHNLNLGKNLVGDFGGGKAWFADEQHATNMVLKKKEVNDSSVLFLERPRGLNWLRIDRSCWQYEKVLLNYDYYLDAHSIRPYSVHKTKIDQFLYIVLKAHNKRPPKWLLLIVRITAKFKRIFKLA